VEPYEEQQGEAASNATLLEADIARQSDMVFAAGKIAERESAQKDTIFLIRGQYRTPKDVQEYWRRKQNKPANLPPVPNTPSDIDYWTPAPPSPERTDSVPTVPLHMTMNEGIAPSFTSGSDPLTMATSHMTTNDNIQTFRNQICWPRPILLPPLTSPGHLVDLEAVLRNTREYYQMCMKHFIDETSVHLQRNQWNVREFYLSGLKIASNGEFKSTPYSAQTAQLEMANLIPDILREQNPIFITCLVQLISHYGHKRRNLLQCIADLICSVVDQTVKTFSASHPLVAIFQAMLRSFDMVIPLAVVLLQSGLDLLTLQLGAEHPQACGALRGLRNICQISGDWAGAVRCSETEQQFYRCKARTNMTAGDEYQMMECQIVMSMSHLHLQNYEEADRLIQEGLAFSVSLDAELRGRLRFGFLRVLGELRRRLRLPGAVEALKEALEIRCGQYGADDYQAVAAFHHLQSVINGNEESYFY
jgi:hypothetical protein